MGLSVPVVVRNGATTGYLVDGYTTRLSLPSMGFIARLIKYQYLGFAPHIISFRATLVKLAHHIKSQLVRTFPG
jgi:hypothetical protein